jgi:hypothetical protein
MSQSLILSVELKMEFRKLRALRLAQSSHPSNIESTVDQFLSSSPHDSQCGLFCHAHAGPRTSTSENGRVKRLFLPSILIRQPTASKRFTST